MTRNKERENLTRKEHLSPERRLLGFTDLNPFQMMRRLSDEMDRMFGDVWDQSLGRVGRMGQEITRSGQNLPVSSKEWVPAIEVFERDKNIIIRADLPGINPQDVKVEVEDDGLVIHGETTQEFERDEDGYYHTERSYGRFYRFIPLPDDVNTDQITANFKNGVLEVKLPQPEKKVNRKQIQVHTEAKGNVDVGTKTTTTTSETDKKSAKA